MILKRRAWVVVLGAVALAACGQREDEPAPRTLPSGDAASVAGDATAPAAEAGVARLDDPVLATALRSNLAPGRLLVLGLDGADWAFLDPELAAGRLPNLGAALAGGARGELVAIEPLLSPLLWTSLATGQAPERHGVLDFFEKDAGGTLGLVSSRARRAPALWDLLSALGEPVGLIGWWATHPAPPLDGVVVSDRLTLTVFPGERDADLAAAVWPPAWRERVAALRTQPAAVEPALVAELAVLSPPEMAAVPWRAAPVEDPLRMLVDIVAATRTSLDLGRAVWTEARPRALMLYLEGPDAIGHLFAGAVPPALPGVDPAFARRFGDTPRRYWRWLDGQLAPLLAALGPSDTLVVVSDHGFRWGSDRPAQASGATSELGAPLWHHPRGLLAVAGAAARRDGRGEGGTLDLLPTLLAILGLPASDELPGTALAWALPASPPRALAADLPADLLANLWSKVPLAAPPEVSGAAPLAPEAVARLRALGYVGESPGAGAGEPLTTGALNNLGARYLATGDLRAAADAFGRAIRADPDYPGAYRNLAQVELRLGDSRAAVRTFLTGLARRPPGAETAAVDFALALRERSEKELAVELLARASEVLGTSYGLALNRGSLLGELGRLDEALAVFRDACALGPESAIAWRNRAVAAAQLGAREEAMEAARRSLELDPSQADLRQLLGPSR